MNDLLTDDLPKAITFTQRFGYAAAVQPDWYQPGQTVRVIAKGRAENAIEAEGARIALAEGKAKTALVEPGGDWPRPTGGGWYELSDGAKVQGHARAHQAQAALAD